MLASVCVLCVICVWNDKMTSAPPTANQDPKQMPAADFFIMLPAHSLASSVVCFINEEDRRE